MKSFCLSLCLIFSSAVYAAASDPPTFLNFAPPTAAASDSTFDGAVIPACDAEIDIHQLTRDLSAPELLTFAYDCQEKALAIQRRLQQSRAFCLLQEDRGPCNGEFLIQSYTGALLGDYARLAYAAIQAKGVGADYLGGH